MATKKSAIVKAVDSNDLVKAGIDVKLSKMEIADYIADKAKEELEAKLASLKSIYNKYINTGHNGQPVILTESQKTVIDGLSNLTGNVYAGRLVLFYSFNNPADSEWKIQIVMQHHDHISGTSIYFSPDASQIPDIDAAQLCVDIRDIEQRIKDFDKKKHRTILLEKILSGNESGKKVLADLQSMVARAVSG